ncbi:endosomal transmembrane epsin interactor 1 isoform X2 [Balearica regulorum gibbericeps]|uniref:endosomal transmembrane epsin interactor 1 isoform X2 n=1 Tax=Balearica regulorum gibbericeps TaxID=100784 RepID=UPI003F633D47
MPGRAGPGREGRDGMALRPGESEVPRRASGAGVEGQDGNLAAGLMPAAEVSPASPGGVAEGQAGVPAEGGSRQGGRADTCPEMQLEATARAGAAASPTAERRGEGSGAPQEVSTRVGWHRGSGGPAPPGPARRGSAPAAAVRGQQPPPPPMSLPLVLPGSCCPVPGLAPLPRPATATTAGTAASAGSLSAASAEPSLPSLSSRGCLPGLPQHCDPLPDDQSAGPDPDADLLPSRPLLLLGLLQIVLGCSLVALNFGALSLSSAPQVKNACPFWAGSSVILSGILGLTTWKRPMMLLANLFVLLSIICVLLNLAGFILGCQGVQFVAGVPRCDLVDMGEDKICLCCEEFLLTKCIEQETVLKLFHVKSCSAAHLLLKKVLFALCALNALTTTVCLVSAALRYLQIFTRRRSCIDEPQIEDQDHILDPDDFVPPVPPPSYFATFYSCTPQTSDRMLSSDVIPLPHIYGARIKGVEVFYPLDPPPPYEDVWSQDNSEQEGALQISVVEVVVDSEEVSDREASQGEEIPESPSRVSLSPSNASLVPADSMPERAFNPLQKRSKSDPVLHCRFLQGDDACPARHVIECPCVTSQTTSWIAAPGELW